MDSALAEPYLFYKCVLKFTILITKIVFFMNM